MADGECIVSRRVSCTEAWPAECGLYNGSCCHQVSDCTVFHQFHIDWRACRIYTEGEFIRADIVPLYNVRCRADIFKASACTAGDQSLVYVESSVPDLALQGIVHCASKAYGSFLLYIMKNIGKVCIYLVYGIDI